MKVTCNTYINSVRCGGSRGRRSETGRSKLGVFQRSHGRCRRGSGEVKRRRDADLGRRGLRWHRSSGVEGSSGRQGSKATSSRSSADGRHGGSGGCTRHGRSVDQEGLKWYGQRRGQGQTLLAVCSLEANSRIVRNKITKCHHSSLSTPAGTS